jgi:hypothetical protein
VTGRPQHVPSGTLTLSPATLAAIIERADSQEERIEAAAEVLRRALAHSAPVCDVCGQRAWPGDDARHIFSRHEAAGA